MRAPPLAHALGSARQTLGDPRRTSRPTERVTRRLWPASFLFLNPPPPHRPPRKVTLGSGRFVGRDYPDRFPVSRTVGHVSARSGRPSATRPGVRSELGSSHGRLTGDEFSGEDVLTAVTPLTEITRRGEWAARRAGSPTPTPLPASAALNYDFRHRQPHRHASLKGR